MAYATYEEYRTVYAGTLFTSEEQFLPCSERASDYMDAVTFDRLSGIQYNSDVQRKILKCCCAIAENLRYYDMKMQPDAAVSGNMQSEHSGAYSVTYANPLDSLSTLSGSTFEQYQYQTALQYLGMTGLMYRGATE